MKMTDAEYMKSNQFRWDVYLLTSWYKNPGFKMIWVVDNFLKKSKMPIEEFFKLRRTPKGVVAGNVRVEPFVCSGLPKIGARLYDKGIDDVFDMALALKNSKIDVTSYSVIPSNERENFKHDRNKMGADKQTRELVNTVYDSYRASSQWHVCK